MSLEKAALITAILGVIALVFLSDNLEPGIRAIDKITINDIDSYVKVSGNITYVKNYPSSTLLKIEDYTGKMYAVLYGDVNITKGPATVTGKVTEYKGILELEVAKISGN